MNTSTKTKNKKFICTILAAFAFILASLSIINFNKTTNNVYALDLSNTIEIENANFTKDTDNIFPIKTISGFSAYSNGVAATENNPNCGVIDLSDDDYSTRFAVAKEGKISTDDKVLMLTSESTNINFGYRTKKTIDMAANSNYMVTADVFTEQNAGIGHIALYDGSKVFSELKNINSHSTWTTYHFFVKTAEDAIKLNLGLNITNKGTVLFDNIACYQINNETLSSLLTQQEDADARYSYVNEVVASHEVSRFTADDIQFTTTNFIANKNDTNYTAISTVLDKDGTNKKAIKIENNQKTYIEQTAKDLLTFNQGLIYKVEITAKAKNLSGNASLKLVQSNLEEGKTGVDSELITISSKTSNSVNNDYEKYNFYVKASPKMDTTYSLVASLGELENFTTGELYISQVLVTKVKTSNIPSSAKIVDLTKNYALSGNSLYVNNGEFDAYTIEDIEKPFPAKATNWTETKGIGTQAFGIVNTKSANFDALENKMFNPYENETNENVLMMYNDSADVLAYTSESKSLSANSYNKFNLSMQTQAGDLTIDLIAKKDSKEFKVASLTTATSSKVWKDLTFYIKTGSQPIDVSIRATLNSTTKACAFIDDVRFNYPSANETEFNACSNSENSVKVDLTDLMINNLFTGEENTSANFEVIDLSSTQPETLVGAENVENFEKFTGSNKNVIKLTNLTDTDYNVTSNIGYKLTKDTKYKFSIDVYTIGLETSVEEADLEKLGFGIQFTGFEKNFVSKQSNNAWTTYTFYIQPDADVTSYLDLSLGNADLAISGTVFFGNIQFIEKVEDNEFDNASENSSTMILNKVTATEENEDKEEDKAEEESKEFDKQTLLYLIPTIIFALAIVICVIGVFTRKIKWKKPSKKSKNSYDRNATVSKQYYERKATMVREEKLRELNKQLEQLHADRIQYEEEYKHNMSKLREMKIKRANKHDIAKLEAEMKKSQRNSSTFGLSVSRIEKEIEYMKTDLYYKSLVKKLASQGIEETEEETK